MTKLFARLLLLLALPMLALSCHHKAEPSAATPKAVDYKQVLIPQFCADSAMHFAATQVGFGFRTPGGKPWEQCAEYITSQMRRWCDTVVVQSFNDVLWDGTRVPGRNIVASLNPTAEHRILLAAHWDSRLWADHDPDASLQHNPVPGANDGASGAALLMEMARAMSQMPPSVGVDFVFFDVEDQGIADWSEMYDDNTWCKGSQYWGQNPHTLYYSAIYGILFDMVGTEHPRYTQEEVSYYYAPALVDKLWDVAEALSYGQVFVRQKTPAILDDHLYVNQLTGIPTIDIVQNSPDGSFFPHWHTTTDNLDHLSPTTLQTVASVVLTFIYADYAAQ